jgi:alkylated DNA repair dioxygenase AlkB
MGGKDYVSWHSDDERVIDQDKAIISVSLGAARQFAIRPKGTTKMAHARVLQHGDVVVMPAGMQDTWEHTVTKTKKHVGVRVNLTFRAYSK